MRELARGIPYDERNPHPAASGPHAPNNNAGRCRSSSGRCRPAISEYNRRCHPGRQGATPSPNALGPRLNGDGDAGRDCVGHGTFVAGLIAADCEDGAGFAGIAPRAGVLAVAATDDAGTTTPQLLARGIQAAADRGARVVAVSVPVGSLELARAVAHARGRARWSSLRPAPTVKKGAASRIPPGIRTCWPFPTSVRMAPHRRPAVPGRSTWADLRSVHVSLDGHVICTVASRLRPEDLQRLAMRGARLAGPAPAKAALHRATGATAIPPGQAVEIDRTVTEDGAVTIAGGTHVIGFAYAGRRVTLRLDGHLMHAILDGALVGT